MVCRGGDADWPSLFLPCIAFWLTRHLHDARLIAGYYLFVRAQSITFIFLTLLFFPGNFFQAVAALLAVNKINNQPVC